MADPALERIIADLDALLGYTQAVVQKYRDDFPECFGEPHGRRIDDTPGLEVTEHIPADVQTGNADIKCARGVPKPDPIPRLPIYPTPDDLPQLEPNHSQSQR